MRYVIRVVLFDLVEVAVVGEQRFVGFLVRPVA
jgi:hypothetical protein